MKQGITIERGYDIHDKPIIRIKKRRGRLSLEEVGDLLRYEDFGEWYGYYAIILNCTESTIGGDGMYDFETPKGDAVDLYKIDEGDECPVCGHFTPPYSYCPTCGASWKDMDDGVEKRLQSMREETERELSKPSLTPEARMAWYWTFIGAVDMARQLGFISDARRLEIYKEVEAMKP